MLPFTAEALSAMTAAYNRDIWPAQPVAVALALAVLALPVLALLVLGLPVQALGVPEPGLRRRMPPWRAGAERAASAFTLTVLALFSAWTGLVFHLRTFAAINFLAPAFAALFVLQALLLARAAIVGHRLVPELRAGGIAAAGLVLAVGAVAGAPLLAAFAGDGWQSAPVVGLTPGPTALFTLGVLLMAEGRVLLHLAVLPALWLLIAAAMAWLLDAPGDLAVALLGLAGFVLLLWKKRERRHG